MKKVIKFLIWNLFLISTLVFSYFYSEYNWYVSSFYIVTSILPLFGIIVILSSENKIKDHYEKTKDHYFRLKGSFSTFFDVIILFLIAANGFKVSFILYLLLTCFTCALFFQTNKLHKKEVTK